jgi:hypothetical protein
MVPGKEARPSGTSAAALESLFMERRIRLQRFQHKRVNGVVKVSATDDFAIFVKPLAASSRNRAR